MKIHPGEKTFPWNQCHNAFFNGGLFKQDFRTHSGENPFPCYQCPKTFYAALEHFRTHSGVKTFPCLQCTKAFSNGWHLKQHLTIHSG